MRSATSRPCAMKLRNFSGAFSGSVLTAAMVTAPATARAEWYSPGGTAAISGGATLPPLKNAPSPAHEAALSKPAFSAAAIASRRFGSVGCAIQCSVASSDALIGGAGFSPAARRALIHAHQTASRLGSAWARNFTASGYSSRSRSSAMYSRGCVSGRTRAIAASLSSAAEDMVAVFETVWDASLISVDHCKAALGDQHGVTVDLSHHAFDLNLDLAFDLDHQTFDDRKSTRLNSSHQKISYAVFCL